MSEGRRIRVRGRVQGVGFRPFVWQLAQRLKVRGRVLNDAEGVLIEATGGNLDAFETGLRVGGPPLARVEAVECWPFGFDTPPEGFVIAASGGAGADTQATPDAATCAACQLEIADPGQRRHSYAFANCTGCGPRFSILRQMPYDRAQTSMAAFAMCRHCAAEYANPTDRRFHAQPIACPDCGPRLWLERQGVEVAGDPITLAAERLRAGEILAVKGLGGFNLACNATDAAVIARLRRRKRRPTKPLALMGTLEMIRALAGVSAADEALLLDPAAPIVVTDRAGCNLPETLAPGLGTLGWMVPHTPLHHLLIAAFGAPLVMTSGNLSGEPQAIGNAEARDKLAAFADAFLMHDRDIIRRLDDSVERADPPMVLRRGRGRVPETLALPPGFEEAPQITAYGAHLKSAICLIKNGEALLSHHLGDLDDALTLDEFRKADTDFSALFSHEPTHVACDLHPDYRSSIHAARKRLPQIEVQHHHGHLASCLAENLWPIDGGPVAGIILDGLGLGTDGTVWGGELLLGDYAGFERVAHLRPAPLPGGDAAAREPWRNLVAQLDQAGLADLADVVLTDQPIGVVRQAAAAGVNTPWSSSAGRLFDAFAAALGLIAGRQTYEGEAAMLLEALAVPASPYAFGPDLEPATMWQDWAKDRAAGVSPRVMAGRFHAGLARAFAVHARALVESGAARAIALSGGCFQNAMLLTLTLQELRGLDVLIHRRIPANDGGLALGQALVAAAAVLGGSDRSGP